MSAAPVSSRNTEERTELNLPEDDPREHAARIERLLGDVRASVGPATWQRVEELVSRLVSLYGAALGRTLLLVEQAGGLDQAVRARLCEDELVSALMALHGMHPEPPLDRARAAAARVRTLIGDTAGTIELALDDARRRRRHARGRLALRFAARCCR